MAGSALASLKAGTKTFIDIIDEATDSAQDGQIGFGSRIGIVSFAATATQDTQLITSVSDLKAAELEELFADLARNISKPGATNVVITDTVSPCFRITSVVMPTKGFANQLSETTVQWQID